MQFRDHMLQPPAGATAAAYRIGALDVLKVTVFQEEDLSFDELQVDASGNVSLPLIGTVRAEGMTAAALSSEIATKLGAKYLVNPQVSVSVASSVSQNVTVEGNVNRSDERQAGKEGVGTCRSRWCASH